MNYINELKEILKLDNIYVQLTLKTILCILIIYIIEKIGIKLLKKTKDDKKEYNYKAMEILLKKKIVTPDTVKILVDQNKIDINNVNSLIEKYEEENND